jgi:release factor glutamine methyltransferase
VSEAWTVRSVLAWGRDWLGRRGVESPRLDAELLVAHALSCDRIRLYVDFDKPLGAEELARIKPLFQRRAQREPVAYILGTKDFYGRSFRVGAGVFIPRPETELLVQLALEALPSREVRVLDLCAGSGAVGISIAAERRDARADLVELSELAAEFARQNAAALAPGRVDVYLGDLFAALPERKQYDAVVANPPYVSSGDEERLAPEIVAHEPREALYAGDDGLSTIRRIVAGARGWLVPGGAFALEVDPGHASAVVALFRHAGFEAARIVKDLAGLDRHVVARAP